MSNERKYKSKYGASADITAAQYLVEFIMERIAKKNKETLPHKFWNIPKWSKQFRMQIKFANELLSEYSEAEVFTALKSKQGQRIYSLGAKKTMITPLIEEMHKQIKNNQAGEVNQSINTDWILEQEMGKVEIDDNIEQIPEKELTNTNLWRKL